MVSVRHKRGLDADFIALAAAGNLEPGQLYYTTDKNRLYMADTASTYTAFARQNETSAGFPRLVVSRQAAQNQIFQTPTASQFVTVALNTAATVDSHNGWNTTTALYTVPQDGFYECHGKVRIADNGPVNIGYGIGIDIANQDSPSFQWMITSPVTTSPPQYHRNGGYNFRAMQLLQGQQVRLFVYTNSQLTIYNAELQLRRVV
jgi:hypothetical protein